MRSMVSILPRLVVAGVLVLISVAFALGQDREARREWFDLANGRTEFDVSDPAMVPSQLALAAEQSGCQYKDDIKDMPVRFISVEKRRLAIVFCRLSVTGSHQVFDLTDLGKPKLVQFPFLAQKDGFGTTPRPGVIKWKRDAGVLEAEAGTDTCPSSRLRHTYRMGLTEGWVTSTTTFVIIRVEVMEDGCGRGEWATIWEALQWPKSAVVR
jgi:hypothetical protein